MEVELRKALAHKGTLYKGISDAVLSQLLSVAKQYGLAAKQAAVAFDKFMVKTRLESACVSADDVAAFSQHLADKQPQLLGAARSNLFNRISLDDMVLPEVEPTPGRKNGALASSFSGSGQRITPYMTRTAASPAMAVKMHTPLSSGKFAERQGIGSIVASFNAQLEEVSCNANDMEVDGNGYGAGWPRCDFGVLGPQRLGDKYMADRLEDKVSYLERRILMVETAAEGALRCEVHPAGSAAQQMALFVGRICRDAEGGRLNTQSLLLEGSQKSSRGSRVRLDISRCTDYRLFPGQVVALLGTNPSGHCIVAALVLAGAATPPLPRTALAQLAGYAQATAQGGLSVVAAVGPFTPPADLEYAPLGALLDQCVQPGGGRSPPDVLLLVGPFVDEEHPLLREGNVDETFDEVYESRVLSQIKRFSERAPGTRVVLVPSTRDLHHHPVLPQPPLPQNELAATLCANPCTLRLNEVVVGVGAQDWLMAANREEIACTSAPQDRLPALAAHLPAQASFFPMFPPPLGTPLDCGRAATALQMSCAPDMLLLPSDLAPFAKLCPLHRLDEAAASAVRAVLASPSDSVALPAAVAALQSVQSSAVCVNPGRLTKGATGGTYAEIRILPLPNALNVEGKELDVLVLHQLASRCRVDIKKI